MKKILFFLLFFFVQLYLISLSDQNFLEVKASENSPKKVNSDSSQWVEMPAGAKPSFMGIHGGTMPVSLLVSADGSSLLSYVGQTGNDFLEILRQAYLPFPSFANATREKFHNLINPAAKSKLYAGNADASLPVLSLSASPVISPDWISHFQPFGLSDEPLSIEGNVSRPEIIPLQKKYRIFFLPEKFFPTKK